MRAGTINCNSCGAAVAGDAQRCEYCRSRVQTVACTACFATLFVGSRYCQQCGAQAAEWDRQETGMPCPTCAVPLLRGTLGTVVLHECERCLGVWLGKATLEEACRNAEQQAAVLASPRAEAPAAAPSAPLRYRACPCCNELMHRVNFARCSGVVVDVCRDHGTWFDAGELQRIVGFVRGDGLAAAREREKEELTHAARRLERARQPKPSGIELPMLARRQHGTPWLDFVLATAGACLRSWLRR